MYMIPFLSAPTMTRTLVPFRLPVNPLRRAAIVQAIRELIQKKVLYRVPMSGLTSPAYYSSLFLVPKPDGTFRPVFNIKRLNLHVDCPHFKMETVDKVSSAS